MITNDKVAGVLRAELGIGNANDGIIALVFSFIPHLILALIVFAFTQEDGIEVGLAFAAGSFLLTTVLGYFVGQAFGNQVGIADDLTDAALECNNSFFHSNRGDDLMAAGMGVVIVQFFCGSLYNSVQAVFSDAPKNKGLSGKRELIAVASIKAALDNNGVTLEQLAKAIQAADPSISIAEVETVANFLKSKSLLVAQGNQLVVPTESISKFYA